MEMDEKGIKLVSGAYDVFMKLGIKSVTMDDVASQLGISKKTLYKYVSDKEDLIKKVAQLQGEHEDSMIAVVTDKNLNAIDETFEIMHFMIGMLKDLHPSIIFDMQKYYPEVLNEMITGRERAIDECIFQNLKKGQLEEVYRKDLNPKLIAHLYTICIEQSFHLMKENHGDQLSFTDRYLEIFRYHIRGIASDKGLEHLKEKMKELEQN